MNAFPRRGQLNAKPLASGKGTAPQDGQERMMGEYQRTTRLCTLASMSSALATAIRSHIEKHELGDAEKSALICCETTSTKQKKGLLGGKPEVIRTGVLLSPQWLLWVAPSSGWGQSPQRKHSEQRSKMPWPNTLANPRLQRTRFAPQLRGARVPSLALGAAEAHSLARSMRCLGTRSLSFTPVSFCAIISV